MNFLTFFMAQPPVFDNSSEPASVMLSTIRLSSTTLSQEQYYHKNLKSIYERITKVKPFSFM